MKSYISGFTECMKKLDKIESAVGGMKVTPEKRRAVEKLADEGWAEWQTALDSLGPIDDGTNDTKLEKPKWVGDELIIQAHGSNALFIEFGTGVHKNHATKYGQQYGYYPTSWSGGPMGSGWLVGSRRQKFKGKWILPKGVIPEDKSGAQYTKKVTRTWMTKKYGLRKKTYFYQSDTPYCYWAEGHRPVNGMYRALKRMQSKSVKAMFRTELLK